MTTWVYVLIIASSIWVFFDARKNGAKRGLVPGFFNMGPISWAICCILLWIVCFPAYLIMRSRIIEVSQNNQPEIHAVPNNQSTSNTIAKYVVICWTLLFAFLVIGGLQRMSEIAPSSSDTYASAGFAIGASLGLGMYFFAWAIVAIPSSIIFMLTRRSGSIVVVEQSTELDIHEDVKKCQYCAETIKKEAVICRFCNRDIGRTNPQPKDEQVKPVEDWSQKAKDHLKNNEIKEAIAVCTKAIKQNAGGDQHYLRAIAFLKAKDKKRMRADLEAAAALGHEKAIKALASLQ